MENQDAQSDYTWADAWFLLAVSYVSPNGERAELSAVIEAADFINHAILTNREIESATQKLTRDGWIVFADQTFSVTRMMIDRFVRLPKKSPMGHLDIVETWLNVDKSDSDLIKRLSRDELIDAFEKILNPETRENERRLLIQAIASDSKDAEISDLVYWPEEYLGDDQYDGRKLRAAEMADITLNRQQSGDAG